MKIIAIESSSVQGGVAILEIKNGRTVLQRSLALKRGLVHGKLLVPALDKMLKSAHWQKNDPDLVAVDIGPGSYTGVRVGLAIAQTIAYTLKIKIIGLASLDIMAGNIGPDNEHQYLCPIIDARWNQVYASIYKKSAGGYKRQTDYLAINPDDLVRLIRKHKGEFLLSGDGLRAYADIFKGLTDCAEFAPEGLWFPRARNVALLGYQAHKNGRSDNPLKLPPLYLRPTEAEYNLKNKKGK